MIDVTKSAKVLLKSKGIEAGVRRLDSLEKKEGVIIRPLPYTTTGTHFDRTREISYLFQVVVKRRSELQAIGEISDIEGMLDGAYLSSLNGSYEGGACEVYTDPQELELNESGFSVYEVRFRVLITKRKES